VTEFKTMTITTYRKAIFASLVWLTAMLASGTAGAANWLLLQGTEPDGSADLARVWGFVQVQYQKDQSDPDALGRYIPPKLIGPNLDSQSAFNVNRARIGVRGVAMPLDSKINYFLLLEMGNNGITEPTGSFAKATDASLTFNHIPGARIRAGLFKYPGAEEGLQAIHVFDYINFTWVTQQMLLERFPNRTYSPNIPPQTLPPAESLQGFDESVGAFRDVGVQVFDAFNFGESWELSYAAMIGNGNGLNFSDNNDDKDLYLYASLEKVYGGLRPRPLRRRRQIPAQRHPRLRGVHVGRRNDLAGAAQPIVRHRPWPGQPRRPRQRGLRRIRRLLHRGRVPLPRHQVGTGRAL
jgi:hypothetical protein